MCFFTCYSFGDLVCVRRDYQSKGESGEGGGVVMGDVKGGVALWRVMSRGRSPENVRTADLDGS